MKLGNKILTVAFYIIIGIPIVLLLLPIMIVRYPIRLFRKRRFEKKYAEFLMANNGKNFFCYNNRRKLKAYAESVIIPNLAEGIDIVYLNGKRVESVYPQEFISAALYQLQNYSRFPHLMKIRDGKLIDMSINNPFYNVLNLNKSDEELLKQIHRFFELYEL